MPGPYEITPETLLDRLGTPTAPHLIDVRIAEDQTSFPRALPTAQLCAAQEVLALGLAPGTEAAVICHKGKKLSHGAAALLRTQGVNASVLAGGSEAWRAMNGPTIPLDMLQPLWVAPLSPTIGQRIANWVIRRFVTRKARILQVPASELDQVADRFDAKPVPALDTLVAMLNLTALKSMTEVTRAPGLAPLLHALTQTVYTDMTQSADAQRDDIFFDAMFTQAKSDTSSEVPA